tara:strand:- start:1209 stop:1799 length:591 start_codon:yes stop_codon:yes gene_type:complete
MKIIPQKPVSSLYEHGYLEANIHSAYAKAMLAITRTLQLKGFDTNPFESGTSIEFENRSPTQPFALFNQAIEESLKDIVNSFTSPLEPTNTRTMAGILPGLYDSGWLTLNRKQPIYIAICPLEEIKGANNMRLETARNTLDSTGKIIQRECVYRRDLSETGWVLIYDAANMLNSIRVINEGHENGVFLYSVVGEIE